jgi:hypothetical protein
VVVTPAVAAAAAVNIDLDAVVSSSSVVVDGAVDDSATILSALQCEEF